MFSGMPDIDDDDFGFFQRRILALSGIHLSSVKKDLVRSRLVARLTDLGLPSIKHYRQYLGTLPSNDEEWQLLINQITTNKTDFFREPAHFKFLLERFLPNWKPRDSSGRLRVWSAACSTGEEPYTLAMVLNRFFQDASRFEILASDIDTEVLEKASNGVYPLTRMNEIPFEYHAASVVKGKGEVQNWFKIRSHLQQRIRFDRINLLEVDADAIGPFDLVFCRNVFIYFQHETIQNIIGSFHKTLQPSGAMILGHSESLNVDAKRWKPYGSSIYLKEGAGSKSLPAQPKKAEAISLTRPQDRRKKVLIVEGLPNFREALASACGQHPRLEVLPPLSESHKVEGAIAQQRPDVIIFDMKLSRHAGVEILEQILGRHMIPVVVLSAAGREDSQQVLRALEMGAVDSISKPTTDDIQKEAGSWGDRIWEAAGIKVHRRRVNASQPAAAKSSLHTVSARTPFIVIGASTGGVQALTAVLTQLPKDIPPILIVQHMPPVFSASFSDRLNNLCPFTVREAKDGDLVQENQVLIAPGAKHMVVIMSKQGYRVQVADGAPVNRHKPSVDMLFNSAAHFFGNRGIGILLTGMGADGAAGLKKMKDQGARTIVQDEASSAVFGMPKEAIRLGAADVVCSLDQVPVALQRMIQGADKVKKIS